ncbi:MAG TPA: hypothetical protein VFQ08_09540, partial [Gaiella sp.]|nr:hypothetical protein [Gaiella sp.]
MRSVADIPGDDVEDDLSGISPELVLIDPELARLVRERQVDEASLTARRSTLRLVEGGSAEPAIVPRAVETAPPLPAAPTAETVTSSVPAPVVEPPREEVAPVAFSASTPVVAEPVVDVLPVPVPVHAPEPGVVARRVIEAEPARAVPAPDVEAPAPLVPDRLADVTVPPAQPTPGFSTMPHPVARPATQRRARASAGRRKRSRARGILAFLVAVAVASAAVLGITRLTAGSSEGPSGKGATAAVGAPPVAAKSGGKTKAASGKQTAVKKQPARSKPKPAATKPAATQKRSGAKTSTKPKTTATAKPKTQASVKPKPKTTTARPKAAATPPKKTAAAPAPAETRRFAWAPVDGAVGYHVELFRGNDRVLAKDTKEPVLELAPSWRYQGRTVTLT